MLTNPEPNRNIEDLNDDEVYAAIRYLEPTLESVSKQSDDAAGPGQGDDNGVVTCICLCIALIGLLATFWLFLR